MWHLPIIFLILLSLYFHAPPFVVVVLCMNNTVSFGNGKYFVLKQGLEADDRFDVWDGMSFAMSIYSVNDFGIG